MRFTLQQWNALALAARLPGKFGIRHNVARRLINQGFLKAVDSPFPLTRGWVYAKITDKGRKALDDYWLKEHGRSFE